MVLDAADQDAPRLQRLAAWPNLSETVLFLPPEAGAGYRIRIFTPRANCDSQATQRRRRLGGGRDVASQGRELGRDSRVELLVDGEDVWSGGLVQAVIAGKIAW
ncbi:PhzF family phenazine biosynthesis protein [Xanthomonas sacchari]|uniref:PhzF family phenazine biosynthesis protein n=1 Tax=Xanthomonas sacchari TaxID=56458 RepID=UPI002258C678|nr:PhzF family phenazine biosynthesis protein [Xanthomonas sacchari]